MRRMPILFAPSAALLLGAAPPAAEAGAAARMQADVAFLASDRLEGRATGSAGYALAADYVAARFKAIGLRPGGDNGGWFQHVRFRSAVNAGMPVVTYRGGRRPVALAPGRDVAVSPSLVEHHRVIRAGLVFVGHGISEPALGVDEYAGLDVRGKIVVALSGTVRGMRGDIAAHVDATKQRTAAARGALGFIEIGRVGGEQARQPVIQSVDDSGQVDSAAALAIEMTVTPDAAERWFEGAPRRLSALRSGAERDRPMRGFALAGELAVDSRSDWREFASPQVIGLIAGGDPALRGEHVVVMAHLDHLGRDARAQRGEDGIFNGALDNAAGVATLLEAARQFAGAARPPRRSILVVATAGEERGLLGAHHLARHPPVPAHSIVAAIDLDMPLLTYDFTDVVAYGAEHSTIADAVAEAARSLGIAVSPDPMPEQNLFLRSDHYAFVLGGVPATFLMTGYANGGRQAWNHYLSRVYHRPNDDLRQPIRWSAGARFAELNYRIARALANHDQRPHWRPGDYFGARLVPAPPPPPR